MTFLVVALQSEAGPIVRRLRLAGTDERSPYRLYRGSFRGDDLALIVSGVGRVASAAASAYLFAHAGEVRDRPWINVGIAGHRNAELGEARLAGKITETATGRSWYPSLVFAPPVPTAELVTVDVAETEFEAPALYDMEASGFFATASRFSPVELIQVFKVVSDTRDLPAAGLDRAAVSRLVERRLDQLLEVLAQSSELAGRLSAAPAVDLAAWTARGRYSRTQQRRLGDLLRRLAVLEPGGPPVPAEPADGGSASKVLEHLASRLARHGVPYL